MPGHCDSRENRRQRTDSPPDQAPRPVDRRSSTHSTGYGDPPRAVLPKDSKIYHKTRSRHDAKSMKRDGVQEQQRARFGGGESQNGTGFYTATSAEGSAMYHTRGEQSDRIVQFNVTQDARVESQTSRWTSEQARTQDSRSAGIADSDDRANPPAEVVFPYGQANQYLSYDKRYRPDPQGSHQYGDDQWTTSSGNT